MKVKQNFSNEIETFSASSIYERVGIDIPPHKTIITQSEGDEIIRIIHNAGRTFVSVQHEHIKTISKYLYENNIADKLCSSLFYREILDLLGYNYRDFLLKPSEEFLQDIKYNCEHTLDFICTKDSFIPQNTQQVESICRGDKRFILNDDFDGTMYSITDNKRIISCSYYKQNRGVFENTCSMQVFSRPEARRNGYGKITTSAATQAVINNNKLALWVCQVENIPSRRIAQSLGYLLLGGELRIVM
ncbi:MAG: GNAT family N-acetyltransferase [Clostridia bacterium]|nr:GNAT family N-acetyltransferase [Clostridia bacterium]